MPPSFRLDKQLQDAARLGSLVDVDAALAYGADPNHRDDSGYAPLFYAAQGNSPDCIRRLVAHGADVNAAQRAGALPLEVAVRTAAADSVAVLLELRANPNPVTRREGSLHPVGLLAQCLTSLMAEGVRSTILAALLAAGANPDAPGHDAVLPLYSVSNTADATRLMSAGASVNAPAGSVLPPPAKWHRDIGRSDIADGIQAFAATHAARARLAEAPSPASRPRPRA